MPVVGQPPVMRAVHPVYDAIAHPMPAMAPPAACRVSACLCRPGAVGAFPPFEGHWKPRGTYFIKPPGGPVVRGPGGSIVAPQPRLPAAPRGLPTPGGQIVGPPGYVAATINDQPGAGVAKKRSWWPWLAAGGAALIAVTR